MWRSCRSSDCAEKETDVKGLPVFDFHVHGGDLSRTEEIAEYARLEGLSGLCLLSLPLAGYPGAGGGTGGTGGTGGGETGPGGRYGKAPFILPATLNGPVLEAKKHLNRKTAGVPVYAFGCLDNRNLLEKKHEAGGSPAQVAALHEAGFDGLKLWEGKPALAAALELTPDHPRIVEACREAGRRGMPVIFHVADPPEFWSPDAGEGFYTGAGAPGFSRLIEGAARLCGMAPDTILIFPHLMFLAADLVRAAAFLDRCPNARFDLAPGNYAYEPLSARRDEAASFFAAYTRRILFGSDGFFFAPGGKPLAGDSLESNRRRCSRLLEFLGSSGPVDNPYPLASSEYRQVRGLELPESVLAPMLRDNAMDIFPRPPREVTR
jgi:hypothetical protein